MWRVLVNDASLQQNGDSRLHIPLIPVSWQPGAGRAVLGVLMHKSAVLRATVCTQH